MTVNSNFKVLIFPKPLDKFLEKALKNIQVRVRFENDYSSDDSFEKTAEYLDEFSCFKVLERAYGFDYNFQINIEVKKN